MFRNIVVPLDGSEAGEKAVAFLPRFVSPSQTHVTLIRVLETLRYAPSRYGYPPVELFDAALHQYEIYLRQVGGRLLEEGYQVTAMTAEGDAAEEILNAAHSAGADLILMATRGRSGVNRWILGSVAERVLQDATTPVLLVRDAIGSASARITRLLVPLDGSPTAEQALPYALKLAQETGAKILLLRILTQLEVEYSVSRWPAEAEVDPIYGHACVEAEEYLETVAAQVRAAGVRCDYRVLRGIAGHTICSTARRRHTDLIVMSTHGHTGFRRWVMGSVAHHVIRSANCPVLVVRGPAT